MRARSRSSRGPRRRATCLDAARRAGRERLHRRAQPARGRRDRPDQQAAPADRGRRPVAGAARRIVAVCGGRPARARGHAGALELAAVAVAIAVASRTRRRRCGSSAGPRSPRSRSPACARSSSTSASTRTSRSRAGGRDPRRVWRCTLFVLPFSSRSRCSRTCRTSRATAASASPRSASGWAGRVLRAGLARSRSPTPGMAIAGPFLLDGGRPRSSPRLADRRARAAARRVAPRPSDRAGLHPLLHGHLGAVLRGVPARPVAAAG